jgi:hypothetical protein
MPAVKITSKPVSTPGDQTHFLVTQPELPEGYTPTGQETEEELAELKVESLREIEMDDMVELFQSKFAFDSEPTAESVKPVTSAGIKAALDAADAKIGELKENLKQKTGLSEDAKIALLDCFEHVAWIDEHGQNYYDDLQDALYPDTGLVRITAVFEQGSLTVYPETPLNDLKPYLTVTGYYKDGSTARIGDYALSGTLEVGTSVITTTKDGKTATFNVTVTQSPLIYKIDSGTDLTGQTFDTGVNAFGIDDDFTILASLRVLVVPASTSTSYVLINNGTIGGKNTLRLSFDEKNGVEYYVTNYVYGDSYQDKYTPGTVYANTEHDVIWVMRNENRQLKKQLYIDGTIRVNKTDDLAQYESSVFSGNYTIGGFTASPAPISAMVNLFRIYDTALSDSDINSMLDVNFSN